MMQGCPLPHWPALVLLCGLLAAPSALAQSPASKASGAGVQARAQAGVHASRAEAAYAAGDLERALIETEAAYKLDPAPVLARNLIKLYLRTNRYEDGIAFVETWLAGQPPAAERLFGLEHLEKLKQARAAARARLPGRARVTTQPPGARLLLDGEPVGLAPQEVAGKAGTHRLRAELEGHGGVEQLLDLVAGETRAVELTLLPSPVSLPTGGAPTVAVGATTRVEPLRPWWPHAVAGSGLVLAGAGIIVGIAARSAASDRDEASDGATFVAAHEAAEDRAMVATGLLISSGLAVGIGLVGYWLTRD